MVEAELRSLQFEELLYVEKEEDLGFEKKFETRVGLSALVVNSAWRG